jgi:hypothetical protein
VSLTVLPPNLAVHLIAGLSPVGVVGEPLHLTATVAYSQGQPVPDGLLVGFEASPGIVTPAWALTQGGQVTSSASTEQCGQVTVTATAGLTASAAAVLDIPCRCYLPVVWLGP